MVLSFYEVPLKRFGQAVLGAGFETSLQMGEGQGSFVASHMFGNSHADQGAHSLPEF